MRDYQVDLRWTHFQIKWIDHVDKMLACLRLVLTFAFSWLLFYPLSKSLFSFTWLALAGEDQYGCSHSRAHGTWLPEPPGPGRGRCHPCGKTKHLPHRLHCQLPCRLKDCPSGEEPLDLATFPPATPCCHRTFQKHIYSIFSSFVFFSHTSETHPCTTGCSFN